MPTKQEITSIFSLLKKNHHPTMLEELSAFTPFQRLVATLLSSRTKDSTTIPIVKKLFQMYPTPKDILKLKNTEVQKIIYGVGFYKIKAQQLIELSKILIEKYNNTVPTTLEQLISLPGVGRKTANCVLAYVFHQPAIAVDTHVHRISNRLGWIKTGTPEDSEIALQSIILKELWIDINRLLVGHGQTICSPINPKCTICPILKYCEFGKKRMRLNI